ncbi:MAG: helix-turn-helix domain-containing protein [Bacilli bacterium]
MKRNTQLKLNDRIRIETYLDEQIPIKKICKTLNDSKQTIYREIQRNSKIVKAKTQLNNCKHQKGNAVLLISISISLIY